MEIKIRKEEKEDFKKVFELIRLAFENEELSDHKEQFLVERLRNSDAFVPELSLIAEVDNQIAGYILLTKINIEDKDKNTYTSLALAPVAVLPNYQGKGIGGKLIQAAHDIAKKMGFGSVMLLGHENYYPKFGYKLTKEFGIKLPFEVPEENCMAIELSQNALQNVSGVVRYPKEFEIE
ncbi:MULTISPECIES: GNAT family N-acetyltransferase [Bacteroidota]|jgi:GNAT superfamily N-acetyltransferase|uniref:Acetyltransferase, GNAT family n=6 Tax=Bacteroidota TaxID=976 RepID=D7VT27_SPHSI|nr:MULTISPECIES: N-acetyltransferase [Bacteroidota]EFK56928.1 acetyltransferase, GNAT family [Sphingobacterium spiritivorum ATCC 33861]MBB5331958.1 putative N-acetyltransferase YhbS [Chryseobacterium koreense]MBE9393979.1 N-acetyltransferase [Elizabethkingia anophelis]MBE9408889.1 N-acetyltransferase [Elizabethkingia anophelis]MBL7869410.1 N-acetyltransferase [Flavobacterium lindanitolerans]